MQEVFYKKMRVGILIRAFRHGSVPITDAGEPLQLVTLRHAKGTYLPAHAHAQKKRVAHSLHECLVVTKGKISVDLYAPDKTPFKKITLKQGDSFILQNGGYGIHVLADAEFFEIKNGPLL